MEKCLFYFQVVLNLDWWRHEDDIRGWDAAGGGVVMEQVIEVGGVIVMDGIVREEKDNELDL